MVYTSGARKALDIAKEKAYEFRHDTIGAHHILLGLIIERGEAIRAIEIYLGRDINPEEIEKTLIEKVLPKPEKGPVDKGKFNYTPLYHTTLRSAGLEASILGHEIVGTHHILLGILAQGQGPAAEFLLANGLDYSHLREVIQRMGSSSEEE